MISRIEFAAEEIFDSGLQQEWLQGADAAARAVIGSVNGPLLQQLLEATEYDDLSVAEMLLKGAPMVGQLDNCDVGDLQGAMVNQLWQRRHASNEKLLSDLREDELADELLRITRDDAAKHRMTEPVLLNETSIKSCLLHPRFAVSQLKPDGKRKVRPIDNFSWGAQPEGETGRPSKKARKV